MLLPSKQVLYEPNTRIERVHFMEAGICSMVATTDRQPSVEVGMVGREGFVGLPVALGSDTATHQAVIQVAGSGLWMGADAFRSAVDTRAPLRALIMRYVAAMLAQVAQTAACNGRHSIESRLARWLLIVHDRVDADELTLTHKFLGQMLGVRRAGVATALQVLKSAKLIDAGHGFIVILDRAELERASCGCYGIVAEEFTRQLGSELHGSVNRRATNP